MNPRKYFPLSKAYGKAFCNRVQETEWLVGNLINTKHSLLIAPRRYGKSSLAEKAITLADLPHIKINFHLCTSEEEITQLIVNHVTNLIGKVLGPVEKFITSLKKYTYNLNPKISFGNEIVSLELAPKLHSNPAIVISETLLLLDRLFAEKNKYAVIFFDEFQEIIKISKESHHLEGGIRTAVQEMQNVTVIFSGSIRSLLLRMFDDESRPLYKLCRKLKLERISALDYHEHLNKIALATWKKELDDEVFNEIMCLSHRHPYYVNYLCDVIWNESEQPPTITSVKKAWLTVIAEEWSDALRELSDLPISQRKILKYISYDSDNITSHETSTKLSMPTSTIASAVESLIEKDYIEVDEAGKHQIINPLLLAILKQKN